MNMPITTDDTAKLPNCISWDADPGVAAEEYQEVLNRLSLPSE